MIVHQLNGFGGNGISPVLPPDGLQGGYYRLRLGQPHQVFQVIPDTGHLAFLEAPQKFNELMLGFLAGK